MIEQRTLSQEKWGELVSLAADLIKISSVEVSTKESLPTLCVKVLSSEKSEVELKYNVVEVNKQLLVFFKPEPSQNEHLTEIATEIGKKWNATKSQHKQFTAATKGSVNDKLPPMKSSDGKLQMNISSLAATKDEDEAWSNISTLPQSVQSTTQGKKGEFVYVATPFRDPKNSDEFVKVMPVTDSSLEPKRSSESAPDFNKLVPKLPWKRRAVSFLKKMIAPEGYVENERACAWDAYEYIEESINKLELKSTYVGRKTYKDGEQEYMKDCDLHLFLAQERKRLNQLPETEKPKIYVTPIGVFRSWVPNSPHCVLGVIYHNKMWVVDSHEEGLCDFRNLKAYSTKFQDVADSSNCARYAAYTGLRLIELIEFNNNMSKLPFRELMRNIKNPKLSDISVLFNEPSSS
ncbi:hypothetical protein D5R81_12810 [Parashewanella spongiae]|uniref:Uncharacterized protein n=1 Tax=Parashewanella spongiae TaxID=342950 RepID=A0A3A6TJ90_9GAMM|nr:hypothetical protein [Parashewanella spongiae]MCL1078823.1 hypothetical protein [Parashewanella spongiae]RJY11898.1 hypothetical protein D5R81_12810 [Parashewanella spongiae]